MSRPSWAANLSKPPCAEADLPKPPRGEADLSEIPIRPMPCWSWSSRSGGADEAKRRRRSSALHSRWSKYHPLITLDIKTGLEAARLAGAWAWLVKCDCARFSASRTTYSASLSVTSKPDARCQVHHTRTHSHALLGGCQTRSCGSAKCVLGWIRNKNSLHTFPPSAAAPNHILYDLHPVCLCSCTVSPRSAFALSPRPPLSRCLHPSPTHLPASTHLYLPRQCTVPRRPRVPICCPIMGQTRSAEGELISENEQLEANLDKTADLANVKTPIFVPLAASHELLHVGPGLKILSVLSNRVLQLTHADKTISIVVCIVPRPSATESKKQRKINSKTLIETRSSLARDQV